MVFPCYSLLGMLRNMFKVKSIEPSSMGAYFNKQIFHILYFLLIERCFLLLITLRAYWLKNLYLGVRTVLLLLWLLFILKWYALLVLIRKQINRNFLYTCASFPFDC